MTQKNQETAIEKSEAAALALFQEDAGAGFEETSADDFLLPFIKILQSNTPEAKPKHADYVEGAVVGHYMDTATQETFPEFHFVPCYYHRAMVEWRDDQGGFVAQHPVGHETDFPRDGRVWRASDDTYLEDTRYLFGLRLLADGSTTPGVVSFKSSQIGKIKRLMSQLAAYKYPKDSPNATKPLPLYSHVLLFSETTHETKKDFDWEGFVVKRDRPVDDAALANAAREAEKMFRESAVRAGEAEAKAGLGGDDEAPAGGGGSGAGEEDLPF